MYLYCALIWPWRSLTTACASLSWLGTWGCLSSESQHSHVFNFNIILNFPIFANCPFFYGESGICEYTDLCNTVQVWYSLLTHIINGVRLAQLLKRHLYCVTRIRLRLDRFNKMSSASICPLTLHISGKTPQNTWGLVYCESKEDEFVREKSERKH